MAALTVFYSWQSDRSSKVCRDFISRALDDAVARLSVRRGLEIAVDSDTRGVPGTPPVNQTILNKIEACHIFLADMTFVAVTDGGKRTPNPNVMAEYGYALKDKGTRRIILAMNTAFGPAAELPFDLHHLRHPAGYAVDDTIADGARRDARARFSAQLELALEVVVDDIAASPLEPTVDVKTRLWQLAIETQNARIANRPPVIVSQPSATVYLVPAVALEAPRLDLKAVASARRLLIPDIQARAFEGQDHTQWWAHGPTRVVGSAPNPEATWCSRLLRPGVIETVFTIGERIDDDPDIGIEGLQLEARLVAAVDRGLELLAAIGLSGPTLAAIALYDLTDVELYGGRGRGRIRLPSLGLTPVLVPLGEHQAGDSLRHAFDELWLASGRADGSPSYSEGDAWTGYGGGPAYAV